jgi:AcrR family transcriptional regulator
MRGFSDEERERIHRELLEAGRRLFAKHGLNKTTIEDLTDDVDIGTSTFYRFYDSKEDLYIAVLKDTGEDVYRRMSEADFSDSDDPQEAIEGFLRFVVDEIEQNPLARQITVDPETRRKLQNHMSDQEREAKNEGDRRLIRLITDPFVEDGQLHGEEPEIVAEAVAAIPYLTLHRDEIGGDSYREVMDFVIETFARGIADD